jgi:hypothetical protein
MIADELAEKVNVLLGKYPHCRISYYANEPLLGGHTWWLSGITPVGVCTALRVLSECGEDVSALKKEAGCE